MSSYRQLKVWNTSFELAADVYDIARQLPRSEVFGLTSQIQRCAISIPSNIAEGEQRKSSKEFSHFLAIARGSAAELSTQLLLVQKIYKIDTSKHIERLEEIQKMLYGLQSKI